MYQVFNNYKMIQNVERIKEKPRGEMLLEKLMWKEAKKNTTTNVIFLSFFVNQTLNKKSEKN